MEKYYFKVNKNNGMCVENCPINENIFGLVIKVGSGFCQECEFCESFNQEEFWIVCKYCKPKDKK